jgi:hypothetical protein
MSTQQSKIEVVKMENKLEQTNILYLKEMEENTRIRTELTATKKLLRDAEIRANHAEISNKKYVEKIDRVLSENVELDNKNLALYTEKKELKEKLFIADQRIVQSDMDYSRLADTFFGKLAVKCGGGRR